METGLSKSFTDKQKVAICMVLAKLSLSDGEVDITKKVTLIKIGRDELNINLEGDEEIKSLANLMRPLSLNTLLGYLQGLNAQQKEFILDAGFRMMKADGIIKMSESDFMNKVTSGLGITLNEIDSTAKKFGWYQNPQGEKQAQYQKQQDESYSQGRRIISILALVLSFVVNWFVISPTSFKSYLGFFLLAFLTWGVLGSIFGYNKIGKE